MRGAQPQMASLDGVHQLSCVHSLTLHAVPTPMASWSLSGLVLDPVTLMFSTALLAAMTAVMSWAAARASVSIRALGMQSWGWSMGFLSGACVLWFMRDRAPLFMTFVVANAMALISCGFLLEAFSRLASVKLPRYATTALVLVGMSGVLSQYVLDTSGVFTITSIAAAFVTMSIWAESMVLRRPKLRRQPSGWFALSVLAMLTVAMAARAVMALSGHQPEAFSPTASSHLQLFAIVAAAAFVPATTLGFFSMVYELMRKQTIEDHQLDTLTRLLTRKAFHDAASRYTDNPAATYALLMIDLDHFKKINDTLGHSSGDLVLKQAGKLVKTAIRPMDLAGRLGGEEFAVLLPGGDLSSARMVAERIVRQAAVTGVHLPSGVDVKFTVSVGYAQRRLASWEAPAETFDEVLDRADSAMYSAKQQGRNRAMAANEQTQPMALQALIS